MHSKWPVHDNKATTATAMQFSLNPCVTDGRAGGRVVTTISNISSIRQNGPERKTCVATTINTRYFFFLATTLMEFETMLQNQKYVAFVPFIFLCSRFQEEIDHCSVPLVFTVRKTNIQWHIFFKVFYNNCEW